MFSTPLTACSSGVATVRAMVSAEAPGYEVVIWTVGGTMFGYWATGRVVIVANPNSVTKTLITVAKRGRSMKKWVSFMARAAFKRPRRDRASLVPGRALRSRFVGK